MTARPISLILAAGLLILIGGSGMAVGGGLLSVANGADVGPDVRGAALAIGTGIAAYGFVAVLAGVALLLFRRWAWRLGVGLVVVGLVALAGALLSVGPDAVLGFGVATWGATLVCLAAPDTRRATAG